MPMRIKPLESAQARPERAVAFLAPERNLDADVEFDPQRDISPKDWEGMLEALEKHRRTENWGNFSYMAMHLLILFPDHRKDLHLDKDTWQKMKKRLDKLRTDDSTWWGMSFGDRAMRLAILFPDRRHELNLNDEIWNKMKGLLDGHRQAKDWVDFAGIAMQLAILFPKRRSELLLDDEAWEGVKGTIDEERQDKQWWSFSKRAMPLAFLFPDRREEFGLDKEVWEGMKSDIGRDRQAKNWNAFSDRARCYAVLAAQDARITADGHLQITRKKPKLANAPAPLPERRR